MKVLRVTLEAYNRGIEWTLDAGETIADCPIADTLREWKAEWSQAPCMHLYRAVATMEDGREVPIQLP